MKGRILRAGSFVAHEEYIDRNIEYSPPSKLRVNIGSLAVQQELGGGISEKAPDNRQTLVLEAGSGHPFMQVLDRHRAKFVRDKKWMPPDHLTDFDEYDAPDRWTRSFIDILTEDGEDTIVSSLRLTKVGCAEDSLSFRMVGMSETGLLREESVRSIARAEKECSLYDLTRLLPSSKRIVSSNEYFQSVFRLIGNGIYHTAIQPEQDPAWLFATTKGVHSKLNSLGMPNALVAESIQPGENQTVLCLVRPWDALEQAKNNPQGHHETTFRNVMLGIEEARRTLSV